jgi:phage terminase large subunit-like protein
MLDGMVGRQHCHAIIITTAGNDVFSFCKKQQDRYEQILKGVYDADNVFIMIYQSTKDLPLDDEENWKLANPSLGTIKSLEKMREDYNRSLTSGTLSTWIYKNLDLWSDDRDVWIDIDQWNELGTDEIPDLKGKKCYGGLDLSQVNDLTSFVLVFPPQNGIDKYFVLPYFWIPNGTAKEKEKVDKVPYGDWAKSNFVFLSEEPIIRLLNIANIIEAISKDFSLQNIFYDRAMAREVELILAEKGINAEPSFQGFGLSKDIKKVEELIALKQIQHPNNPCLNWCMSNASCKSNDKTEKMLIKTSGYRKIDGAIATVMVIGACTVGEFGIGEKVKRTSSNFRYTV